MLFCQIVHFKRLIMVYSTRKADFRNQSQRLKIIKRYYLQFYKIKYKKPCIVFKAN